MCERQAKEPDCFGGYEPYVAASATTVSGQFTLNRTTSWAFLNFCEPATSPDTAHGHIVTPHEGFGFASKRQSEEVDHGMYRDTCNLRASEAHRMYQIEELGPVSIKEQRPERE